MTLDSATANFAVTTLGGPLPFEAGAIAVGSARGAGTDVVVASSELVVIPYASPDPIERCDLDAAVRAMAVGDQWIAVGQSDGIGQVWVLTPPYDAPDADCPQQAPLAGFTESVGFGTALLAADVVNDDGVRELIVSAPAERTVYVYDPADVTTALARYTVPGGSTSCGSAIAVGTVERTLTLVLGDPDYVGELESPGVVWLQDLETPGADPQPLLSPNSEDILRFGQQVGVLSFTGPEGPVDLVWATAEAVTAGDPGVLYLFFWVNSADADPRVLKE